MRHPWTQCYAHLVWSTWKRAPLITPELQPRLYAVIQHQASRLGADVIAIGGIEDHVHVLVRFPPNLALAVLVQRMKGALVAFRHARAELAERLQVAGWIRTVHLD